MGDDRTGDDKHGTQARSRNFVRNSDIVVLVVVGFVGLVVLVIFGAALFQSDLIDFPDMSRASDPSAYFNDTLVYRERRVALSLVLRTFVTGFSFIVGLALCTMGGMFILRQVTRSHRSAVA